MTKMLRNQPGINKDRHSEFNTGKPLSYPRKERRWFPWATCAEPRSTEEASNRRKEHRSKVAVARGATSSPRGLKLPCLLPLSHPPAFYPCLLWTITHLKSRNLGFAKKVHVMFLLRFSASASHISQGVKPWSCTVVPAMITYSWGCVWGALRR